MGLPESDLQALRENLARPRDSAPVQTPTVSISFTVDGEPIPKGSMRGYVVTRNGKPHAALTSDNDRLGGWRDTVAAAAARHRPAELWRCAVRVSLLFRLPRPPSAPKSRQWPVVKPDLDKLERAMLDALTGIIWKDDAQVVQLEGVKAYGVPGVVVTVNPVVM